MAAYPAYDGNEPCRQVDPDIFYPVTFNGLAMSTKALLNSMCNDCHMREPCLSWAIGHEKEGYWAGTTPEDRMRLRKKLGVKLQSILPPFLGRVE